MKQQAQESGKGIIAFSPLAQGMLTDKYIHGIPADSRVAKDGRYLHASDITDEKVQKVIGLNEIAKQRGQTLAQMALSWVLKDEDVTSVLIGASKPEQIIENLKIVGAAAFTEDELTEIDRISKM